MAVFGELSGVEWGLGWGQGMGRRATFYEWNGGGVDMG